MTGWLFLPASELNASSHSWDSMYRHCHVLFFIFSSLASLHDFTTLLQSRSDGCKRASSKTLIVRVRGWGGARSRSRRPACKLSCFRFWEAVAVATRDEVEAESENVSSAVRWQPKTTKQNKARRALQVSAMFHSLSSESSHPTASFWFSSASVTGRTRLHLCSLLPTWKHGKTHAIFRKLHSASSLRQFNVTTGA